MSLNEGDYLVVDAGHNIYIVRYVDPTDKQDDHRSMSKVIATTHSFLDARELVRILNARSRVKSELKAAEDELNRSTAAEPSGTSSV